MSLKSSKNPTIWRIWTTWKLWTAGKYNSFACNDPKKYPSKPYLRDDNNGGYAPGASMSDEEMENWAKQFCAKYPK